MSNKSNNQITEAINLNEVTSILLNKGFMLYRPEVDFDGVDFLLKTPLGFIQKCQLKSRAYVEWNRYGGKDIFMVFPGKGDVGNRDWYLIPHDKLFGILNKNMVMHPNGTMLNMENIGIVLSLETLLNT